MIISKVRVMTFSNSLLEAWADDVAGGLDAVPDG